MKGEKGKSQDILVHVLGQTRTVGHASLMLFPWPVAFFSLNSTHKIIVQTKKDLKLPDSLLFLFINDSSVG